MEKDIAISPEELKRMLDVNEVRFLFDLRNPEEFESWRIEGHHDIETVNLPQIKFVGEEDRHTDIFPRNRRIISVCAHGDSSRYAAEFLRERGFDALSLAGGMDAWSEYYEVHKIYEEPDIYQCYRVAKGCISYLILSGDEAAVIDAPRHTDFLVKLATSLGVKIKDVLETHLHADHISGGREIAARSGAGYFIHPGDCESAAFSYTPLSNGQEISVGGSRLQVMHSPGHTPGSTSFLLEKGLLFTGDIIMKTGIGRPDLGGKAEEWAALLYDTLFNTYAGLDDGIVVLPSHAASMREQGRGGAITATLGETRRGSDLFRMKERGPFIGFIKGSLLENPARYQDIRKVNLGLAEPDETEKKRLEIGKNLCGMAKK